jgi:hypothetical protein
MRRERAPRAVAAGEDRLAHLFGTRLADMRRGFILRSVERADG